MNGQSLIPNAWDDEEYRRYWLNSITSISKWSPTLYFGGEPGATNIAELERLGVTAVMNLTTDHFQDYDGTKISYCRLDQEDGRPIPHVRIKQYLQWMTEHQHETIYLHCQAGISRTPSFLVAWMFELGAIRGDFDGYRHSDHVLQSWDRFMNRVAKARPIIDPAQQLKLSILDYFCGVER